ncbi:hypothetical protein ACFSUS_28910 [Spirosoma soli]|uniref:Malate dehydrogenase n=1 Tax=Spirosoma soli TaxID=1770529 RepID=A0ABW5MDV4_9BACT
MITIERLEQLVQKGNDVLRTHVPNAPNIIGFPTLDSQAFTAWQSQVLHYLQTNLSNDNQYVISFRENVKRGFKSSVEQGIGILKSLIEDISLGLLDQEQEENSFDSINSLYKIFDKFHLIVRQLRSRHSNRPTIDISDEYDVQDLLHALLTIDFNDIRAEEWTPSYAGKSSRMDFLLKEFKIVIEVKKTRVGLTAKEVGTQLIEDIARYRSHLDCETLLCFVYDPEGYVGNPRGIENDLSRDEGEIKVRVYIRP